MSINLIIVEDHTLFREGLKSLLGRIPDFKIIAEYANGKEYCDHLEELNQGIVLMDIEMPEMGGIEASLISNKKRPDIKIIALTMYSDHNYYYEMIKSGVSGFVLKEATTIELEKAIRDVHEGLGFFTPELLKQAFIGIQEKKDPEGRLKKLNLSSREIEILNLVCKGMSNKEISQTLFLSPKTIESHKSSLFLKTETRNTAGLVIFAVKNELIKIH